MISKQDKQKILNGAYGISRDGSKCKFVGTTTSSNFKYLFVYFNEKGLIVLNAHLSENFIEYNTTNSRLDIVGLWEDKPQPESVKPINDLPSPLTKPQDNMYYVNQCGTCWSGHNRNMDINLFNERVYFASEEDARAWFNAMKNHK